MTGDRKAKEASSQRTTGLTTYFSEVMSFVSLILVTLTIGVVPWILGGAIPQAGLVLQSGAVLASVLAMGSMFLSRRFPKRLPVTCLPFLGFCLIGLVQLLPVYRHPALEMEHAVLPELAKELPATQKNPDGSSGSIRSVMPAETRLYISQMLSLALLSVTLFEVAGTRREILIVVAGLVLSGCGMSALALSQQFGAAEVLVGNDWKISDTTPFGCFVNPNNAAGWLMICLSGSLLLCGMLFTGGTPSAVNGLRDRTSRLDGISGAWQNLVGHFARMNTAQVLAGTSVILLLAGIAATLSRAGITATVLGMTAFFLSRYRTRGWGIAIFSLGVILVLTCLLIVLMDLDTVVVSELRTLKDPVTESTGRLLHWTDSLRSGLDFPLLGSGLGAYRYGSLPYQRHYTGKWFQRADNQYVEVFVESGAAGLLCFAGFGIFSLMLVRRILTHPAPRHRSRTVSLRNWLASSVLFCVVAIAGAAFFDYGISLPSVAGAFVILVVLLERQSVDSRASGSGSVRSWPASGNPSAGPILAVWTSLLVSATILLPDTFAAARIHEALAPVERQVDRPEIQVLFDRGDQLLRHLDAAIASRPDDVKSKRIRVLFAELLVRRELLHRAAAGREMTAAEQENGFRKLNIASLTDSVLSPATLSETQLETRNEVKFVLEKHQWRESARNLLRESAWTLTVPRDLALCDLLLGDDKSAQVTTSQLRFAEPHGAASLYIIGHAMLQAGRIESCRTFWNQSLSVSESFRPAMLSEAGKALGVDVALEWLLPDSYEPCVKAAIGIQRDKVMEQRLFEYADRLWESSRPRMTVSVAMTRASHLDATGGADAAAAWLAECLLEMPQNVALRKRRAFLLQECGKNSEAYDEWLRVQSFNPTDADAEQALERLLRLPPTTELRRGVKP